MTGGRRGYIDWLRGIGVLVMIEAHALDAWTAVADRSRPLYGYAMVLGGFGAPVFLFLAGSSLALAAGRRTAKGAEPSEAANAAARRGWQIFGLAFLFRLQAWVLSGGAPLPTLLKVDILNIMGLSMVAAALLWNAGRNRRERMVVLAAAAAAIAMVTPLVRSTSYLAALPDPIESYLRPLFGRGTFTLFPWAGFLLAGAVVGVALDRTRDGRSERRLNVILAALGPGIAIAAYGASWLPPLYPETSFWTSSPTFFFLRVGVLLTLVPLAYAWEGRPWSDPATRRHPVEELGRASLFVYWIHVEMVYGAMSAPLHKRFSLEEMAVVYVLFGLFLFGLVRLKQTLTERRHGRARPIAADRAG